MLCNADRRAEKGHEVHFPLNGLDLDFLRYSHPRFDRKSVAANRVVQDYLFPTRLDPEAYTKRGWHRAKHEKNALNTVRRQDKELYNEYFTLDQTKTRTLLSDTSFTKYNTQPRSRDGLVTGISLEDAVFDVVQRFFLEKYVQSFVPVLTVWERLVRSFASGTRFRREERKQNLLNPSNASHISPEDLLLYSGPVSLGPGALFLPSFSSSDQSIEANDKADLFMNNSLVLRSTWGKTEFDLYEVPLPAFTRLPRRDRSVPALRTYSTAGIALLPRGGETNFHWLLSWPKLSLRELDHRTRRRSLSRRHIARMFEEEISPLLRFREANTNGPNPGTRCHNCNLHSHGDTCGLPCGHCGTNVHHAGRCNVPKDRRCKCTPFPLFHRARDCNVQCSRPCGNPFPPGHKRHPNAMTCKYRCCMCGLKGHSGSDCKLKQCRCKGMHLGQDCSWNPTCLVRGCDRFLCGVHCRECGSADRPFVAWRCKGCLNNGEPVGAKAEDAEHGKEKEEDSVSGETG